MSSTSCSSSPPPSSSSSLWGQPLPRLAWNPRCIPTQFSALSWHESSSFVGLSTGPCVKIVRVYEALPLLLPGSEEGFLVSCWDLFSPFVPSISFVLLWAELCSRDEPVAFVEVSIMSNVKLHKKPKCMFVHRPELNQRIIYVLHIHWQNKISILLKAFF